MVSKCLPLQSKLTGKGIVKIYPFSWGPQKSLWTSLLPPPLVPRFPKSLMLLAGMPHVWGVGLSHVLGPAVPRRLCRCLPSDSRRTLLELTQPLWIYLGGLWGQRPVPPCMGKRSSPKLAPTRCLGWRRQWGAEAPENKVLWLQGIQLSHPVPFPAHDPILLVCPGGQPRGMKGMKNLLYEKQSLREHPTCSRTTPGNRPHVKGELQGGAAPPTPPVAVRRGEMCLPVTIPGLCFL